MSVVIDGTLGVSKTQANSAPWLTGMMMGFGNVTPPDGWLECNGAAVSRTTYAGLFTAIGTKWGVGDGTTTFNVPDLRAAGMKGAGANTLAYRNGVDATDGYYGDDKNAGAGDAVGDVQIARMQGHRHTTSVRSNFGANNIAGDAVRFGDSIDSSTNTVIAVPTTITDTVNGAPRTGKDTQVYSKVVLWCIKT